MGSISMWANFLESFKICLITKKMVLYSSSKFDKLEPGSNIQSRFDLAFWQTSKQVY